MHIWLSSSSNVVALIIVCVYRTRVLISSRVHLKILVLHGIWSDLMEQQEATISFRVNYASRIH